MKVFFFFVGYTKVMEKLQFSVEIHATRQKVWDTLWQDETFRKWAGIIDPETHMVGDLKEGNEVQFISVANGYGVTSLVEKLVPGEFLLLRHHADTQEEGKREREKEWTGGEERYTLTDNNGTMTLTVVFDVPLELEEYFRTNYPKALEQVKKLAEYRSP
jgi:uncharacterized protein YndB with AHSA1/START domain